MKVLILTAFNREYAPIADLSLPLMKLYADRHGYSLEIGQYAEDPQRLEDWGDRGKWGMFLAWYGKYDAIMWLDIDTLVMNHNRTVEDMLQRGEFIWSYDVNGPCSGWWIAECNARTRMLASKIRHEALIGREITTRMESNPTRCVVQYEPYGASDQMTMRRLMTIPPYSDLLANCVSLKEAGHCFDFRALDLPKEYDYLGNYEPGDWLYTVPSLPLERRIPLLARKAVEFYDALPTRSAAVEHHRQHALAAAGEPAAADA